MILIDDRCYRRRNQGKVLDAESVEEDNKRGQEGAEEIARSNMLRQVCNTLSSLIN